MVAIVDGKNNLDGITEDEATLYDRQIRLWGLDAQKRLRKTQLLVIGLSAVSGEAIKNIVLAGIDSITLCDNKNASIDDFSNFLIPQSCYGKNKAESAVKFTQDLNPTVKVQADTRSPEEIDEDFIKKFNVVVMTNCDLRQSVRIDELCHKNQIKFYCSQVWGSIGYYFADLSQHQFVLEKIVEPTKSPAKAGVKRSHSGQIKNDVSINLDDDDEPSTSTKNNSMVVDDDIEEIEEVKPIEKDTKTKKSTEPEKIYVKKNLKYPIFSQALNVDLTQSNYQTKLRRNKFDPTFFAILSLSRFNIEYNRNPAKATQEQDFAELLRIRSEIIQTYKIEEKHFPKELLFKVLGEFSPVCAVVGGVLAQDIIFAISGTEETNHNFFLYNPIQRSGHVLYLGPKESE